MDISICIANYNGEKVIADCLNSIYEQDFSGDIEVIVFDDASQDKSIEIIKCHFPHCTLIESKINVGFCIANNNMVSICSGKYILLLNNDAKIEKNALSSFWKAAENLPENVILSLSQYEWDSGKLFDHGMYLDLFFNPIPNHNRQSSNVATVMGACLWLRKSWWCALGGFPSHFKSIGEDLYLCIKTLAHNGRIVVLTDSCYRHKIGHAFGGGKIQGNTLKTSFRRRKLSESNKLRVMFYALPSPLLIFWFPISLLSLQLEGLMLALIKLDYQIYKEIYFESLFAVFPDLPVHLRERQSFGRLSLKHLKLFSCIPYKLRMLLQYGPPIIGR